MSTEEYKAILRQFFEVLFNAGDLSIADEVAGINYLNHNPVPGELPGREGLKAFVTYLRTAFPDIHFTIEDQVAEGDKVATRFIGRGTHQAEFAGIPATGRRIAISAFNIHRVTEGKIEEGWLNWDALGMMQQLGVIPRLGEGGA